MMKRFDLYEDGMSECSDGDWISYTDHVEAMKRIAGDSAQEAEREKMDLLFKRLPDETIEQHLDRFSAGINDAHEQAKPVENHSRVCLNGAQLLEALDFIAPDRDTDCEQLESEVTIQYGGGHDGAGYYCWVSDYPEEGAILLDGESASSILAAPAPASQQAEPKKDFLSGWREAIQQLPISREDAAPAPSAQQAQPVANNEAYDLAYDKIDRFLRSNLDDDDYAEFSRALDSLFAAPAPASPAALADAKTLALGAMVDAMRWWGAQEDGIPAECKKAFDSAMLALGWSYSHPQDLKVLAASPAAQGEDAQ